MGRQRQTIPAARTFSSRAGATAMEWDMLIS